MKVLDFGLAKLVADGSDVAQGISRANMSMSPTLSVHGTFAGVILGTAAYMSLEQARGKSADNATPVPVAHSSFNEDNGVFAPDGRWMAYTSNESGREEIYVQTFPPTGGKWQISRAGGTRAAWRGDGREVFFLAPDGALMSASVDTAGQFVAGIPRPLFVTGITDLTNSQNQPYAVSPDGQRVLLIAAPGSKPMTLSAIVNWSAPTER